MTRTKIIATVGPKTSSSKNLKNLINAGVDIFRLNGSHSNFLWHAKTIEQIRKVSRETPILFDVPGRKIRTTDLIFKHKFDKNQIIKLVPYSLSETKETIPINILNLADKLETGQIVFADDGTLMFEVASIDGKIVSLRARIPGELKSKKGINIPNSQNNVYKLSRKDHEMLNFVAKFDIDMVGISFVDNAKQISDFRRNLPGSYQPQLISKIENSLGYKNMEEIIKNSDMVMIDRGDLSVETTLHTVTLFQKEIINKSREFNVPVIVATEVLHTMIENKYPTKAEISDITNSVLDGASAIMLSGETAIGNHPIEAVKVLAKTIQSVEQFSSNSFNLAGEKKSFAESIASLSHFYGATKIITLTRTGYLPKLLSQVDIPLEILAVTNNLKTFRKMKIFRGITPFLTKTEFNKSNLNHVVKILEELHSKKKLTIRDKVLVTAVGYPTTKTKTNTIQILSISELKRKFDWN